MSYKRRDTKFAKRIARLADRKRAFRVCREVRARFKTLTAYEINSGECFEFATIVFDLLEGSKIAGHNILGCGHCWVEYRGMLYDAEVPNGVRSWLKLPFWVRLKDEAGTKAFNAAVRRLR